MVEKANMPIDQENRLKFDPAAVFKAGTATRIVNPTNPTVPVGHGCKIPFSGVYSDISVRALVLEDYVGRQIVIVTCDLCQVAREVTDSIKKRLKEAYNFEEGSVCVHATHSHSGPPIVKRESPEFFDQAYVDFFLEQTQVAVGDALKAKLSVSLKYCEDVCTNIAINRRGMVDGKMLSGGSSILPNNRGVVDFTVRVIEINSVADGRPIAIVAEHAAHPVVMGASGLGAEFPGYMRQLIEKRNPGCTAFFLQGCTGNIRIRLLNDDATGWIRGTPEMAARFGYDLADAVERAMSKQPLILKGPIASRYEVVEAKLDRDLSPLTWPIRIQTFKFGDVKQPTFIMIALGGEPFIEYAIQLEKRLAPCKMMVLGYSNALEGYLPTAVAYAEGGYEPTSWQESLWSLPGAYTPEIESTVINVAERLAKS